MQISRLLTIASVSVLYLSAASSGNAQTAVFVQNGQLLIHGNDQTRDIVIQPRTAEPASVNHVSEYWGSLSDERLIVTLEPDAARDVHHEDEDHHCSAHAAGEAAWGVNADGKLETMLCTNVLRAYPSPTGDAVALISPDRDLSLWQGDVCTSITAPGRVSNVGWSPDGRYLVASVYPPDWSHGAVSEANSTAEFLRLQNADLYLFDVNKMEFVSRLTDDPGTEYGAFFSQDGRSLFYIWLHLTEDEGGLMRLDLDRDDVTSAGAPAVKLTNAGNDPGETPLGRVTTYVWQSTGKQLIFEAGLPDGSGEIWKMDADGKHPERLAAGRKPQAVSDQSVAFMGARGAVETIELEPRP